MEKFEKDLNDPATILRVDKDYQLGHSVGVGGTPTIFINGSISKARTLDARVSFFIKCERFLTKCVFLFEVSGNLLKSNQP